MSESIYLLIKELVQSWKMDWTLKSSEDFEQYIPILLKINSPTYFNF